MKLPDRKLVVYTGIILFGLIFLLPFLGSVHLFDWDEINFAESAREMIETGNYLTVQIDYMPFWEKPPLFFWLQVISMKLFGINEFAARFPNFICGIISLVVLYYLGRQIYGHRFGLLWLLTYGTSILPFFYFRSGIIDPWFNLFILAGIAWFIFYFDPERSRYRVRNVMLSALFLGLAVLTKGPVAVLIFLICFLVFLVVKRFRLDTSFRDVVLFIVVLTAIGGTWFLLQVISGNIHILRDFIAYQIRLFTTGDAGHSGFFGYHLVVVFLGVFPASVIALKSFTKKSESTELRRFFRQWMFIMFWVVIILFSIVQTKILHYSSLTYFPLTYLAAWVWEKWLDRRIEIPAWLVVIILLIGLFYAGISVALPLAAAHPRWLLSRGFNFLDEFTRGAIEAKVHWSGYEWIIGVLFFLGLAFSAIQLLRRNPSGPVILHLV
ncbi:MAG: glycosyl transferase, partial [Bacteroidetes bacterium]